MSGFDTTLDVLMSSENRDAAVLLRHLLTHGDMNLRQRTVERLLTTSDGPRQALLVEHFNDLGHDLEKKVLASVSRLGPGLRQAMSSRRPSAQTAVLQVAEDTEDHSLAYLVGEGTSSADESVRAKAVELLWCWSVGLRRHEMELDVAVPGFLDGAFVRQRKFVLEGLQRAFALRSAADSPRVLRSVAMLADESAPWFWSAMAIRRDERRRALLQSLTDKLDPEMFAFVVRALERESGGAEAAELLHRRFQRRDLELLLKEFGRQPTLSQTAVRRLRDVPWLSAGETALEELPADLVAAALALAVRSGVPSAQVAVVCRTLAVGHGEAEARRVATEALAHCGDSATEELRLVAGKAPRGTAALAVLHLARRGAVGSPSEPAVANLLRDWWDIDETERREIGRALTVPLKENPQPLRRHLAADASCRSAAVSLVRFCGVAEPFTAQLGAIARDESDRRLQSAALAAVAESHAAGVVEILKGGLRSGDARVRANALEALDRRDAEAELFLPFTNDSNNRVRANAALALIERSRPEGRETLREMLKAGEAERLSALWVFSKARPQGFVKTAELLSRQDPSGTVRHKAAELLASV
jgi:hypothetical protein